MVPFQKRTKIANVMSIDVEEYFHVSAFDVALQRSQWPLMQSRVVASTMHLMDLLDQYQAKATFFVLGCVAERHPSLVQELVRRGHELASHGYAHRLIYEQTPEAFRADVRKAKTILEQASGTAVSGYRAPSFSITNSSLWALDILLEEGFSYDASVFPVRHDRYGIPKANRQIGVVRCSTGPLIEVPASTVRLCGVNIPVGGGGYFRLFPYWWTKWALTTLNTVEGQPCVFYLHPWELDPEQPRIPADRLSHFRHYTGLRTTQSKLHKLLADFEFTTMARYVSTVSRQFSSCTQMAACLPYSLAH